MAWLFHLDTVENWAYYDNVFTQEECDKIKRIALAKGLQKGTVIGKDGKGEIDLDTRKNSVVWINERDNLNWMYQRLAGAAIEINKQFFQFDLYGFTEDMQFTEYKAPGEHYNAHIDRVFNGVSRKLSMVVQLTDPEEYEGGELEINTGKIDVMKKDQGSVFFFPSFVMHEVKPVTKGTRHSLVAWIGGKNFK